MIQRRKPIRPRARRPKRTRNPEYLAFIRSLPCLICARRGMVQESRTDAHHHGPRGLGVKVPDERAVPLCHDAHHQYGPEAVHVLGKRFAEYHGIDMEAEIGGLQARYLIG